MHTAHLISAECFPLIFHVLWTQTRMPSSAKGRSQLSKVIYKGWGEKPGISPFGNTLGEGGCSLKCFSHSNPQRLLSAFLAPFLFLCGLISHDGDTLLHSMPAISPHFPLDVLASLNHLRFSKNILAACPLALLCLWHAYSGLGLCLQGAHSLDE